MEILGKDLTKRNVLLVAEIGLNHNGDMKLAKDMIQSASESGADIVKFQKRTIEKCFQKKVLDAPYLKPTSLGKTYREHKLKLEFSIEQLAELKKTSDKNNIGFMCTPFDLQALEEVIKLGVPAIKIASHLLTNHELIIKAASYGLPVILSTGMATREEVMATYGIAKAFYPKTDVALLQCTSCYPAAIETLNVLAIKDLQNIAPIVGFSNHCANFVPSICAVAIGAKIIEQHFTLSHNLPGPDQKASLIPTDFRFMADAIKDALNCIGTEKKEFLEEEKENRTKHHRTIVAARNLNANDYLRREDVVLLAPEEGVPAYYLGMMLGKKLKRDIKKDELIKPEDLL
ncbi:MAG: N-acetylneuraminate synthase family protein [Elusimicrobiota bacterium]